MKHMTTCDHCGKPLEVEYSEADIKSMEEFDIDWRSLQGRCNACHNRLMVELGYVKPAQPQHPKPMPMTEEEIKAHMPLKFITASAGQPKEIEDDGGGYIEPNLF